MATSNSTGAGGEVQRAATEKHNGVLESVPKSDSLLEGHYKELLRMIEEIGRDVKPSYTNSKASADRLKKNIMMARAVLRDCLCDLDKLS